MSKEHWGYAFWGSVGAVVAVPELVAAFDRRLVPFPTISETARNLERRHSSAQLVVFAGMTTLTVHLAFPALFEKVGLATAATIKKLPSKKP